MKPNKGFITVLMMVLISISLSTFSRAAFDTFSDVPNDSPFHESIFYLAERGIVCGEGNGRYVPDAPVTVRQWATMLCRALGDAAPLNYDDDCIRQGYSDGWLEMTAITAPDSDLCRYAIYKSGFAAFGVDLYSLQLYPNEGKLSQQSEVLRAAADFGLCEETCDGTEIITRGEAAELLYALLTKTFAVVPPPMLDNIPLDNKAGVALNNIRQGYSDGWLEMTAITAPDSDLCRYAIYKSGFAAFGVDLYSLQLYPNEGKLSQQSEVLRAAADFGLCEETCDGTEIITRGEAAELLYALLTKTFAVVPPPMLDNIPLDNKAGVALNNYLLEIQKIPESMMQSFAEKGWQYVIDFDYLAKLSKKYDLGCTGATIYEGRKIIISSAESTIHEFGHFLDGMMGFPSRTKGFYQRESASAASLLRTYALTDAQEYFADCFVYWIKNRGDGKKMAMLQNAAPETYHYFKMLEENDWKPSLSP